jgi:DNA-binding transcriptional MerR regulator
MFNYASQVNLKLDLAASISDVKKTTLLGWLTRDLVESDGERNRPDGLTSARLFSIFDCHRFALIEKLTRLGVPVKAAAKAMSAVYDPTVNEWKEKGTFETAWIECVFSGLFIAVEQDAGRLVVGTHHIGELGDWIQNHTAVGIVFPGKVAAAILARLKHLETIQTNVALSLKALGLGGDDAAVA